MNKKANILIVMFVFFGIFAIIVPFVIILVGRIFNVGYYENREKALYLAYAGLNEGINWVLTETTPEMSGIPNLESALGIVTANSLETDCITPSGYSITGIALLKELSDKGLVFANTTTSPTFGAISKRFRVVQTGQEMDLTLPGTANQQAILKARIYKLFCGKLINTSLARVSFMNDGSYSFIFGSTSDSGFKLRNIKIIATGVSGNNNVTRTIEKEIHLLPFAEDNNEKKFFFDKAIGAKTRVLIGANYNDNSANPSGFVAGSIEAQTILLKSTTPSLNVLSRRLSDGASISTIVGGTFESWSDPNISQFGWTPSDESNTLINLNNKYSNLINLTNYWKNIETMALIPIISITSNKILMTGTVEYYNNQLQPGITEIRGGGVLIVTGNDSTLTNTIISDNTTIIVFGNLTLNNVETNGKNVILISMSPLYGTGLNLTTTSSPSLKGTFIGGLTKIQNNSNVEGLLVSDSLTNGSNPPPLLEDNSTFKGSMIEKMESTTRLMSIAGSLEYSASALPVFLPGYKNQKNTSDYAPIATFSNFQITK